MATYFFCAKALKMKMKQLPSFEMERNRCGKLIDIKLKSASGFMFTELKELTLRLSKAKATGGVTAPPGISSTTPIKAGGVAPGEKAAPKAARPGASSERTASNEAGAKAGQLLLNLLNNKEEKPIQNAGAALLQQLKGGGKKPEGSCLDKNWSRLVMVERSQGPQHFQPTAWLPRVAF
ncbi:unnamed protein product [Cladocopium goreaui]|uniref:Uncharacterized protein n=1 Tax=Cladocopium goreaui TaxID=2562237 RepID=A0A9P1CF41_9DINO|nr:unnamed protein product [Cladocopium goreaui]